MFESTVALLDCVCGKLAREKATGFSLASSQEARKRLLQLDRLLHLVREMEAQHARAFRRVTETIDQHSKCLESHRRDHPGVLPPEDSRFTPDKFLLTPEEHALSLSSVFAMELFTECFYFISHRLLTLLRVSKPIPGIKRDWDKSLGARIVRN